MVTLTAIKPCDAFASFQEITELVAAFDDCTLPRARWTHRAHLTVAFWYLLAEPLPVATENIRLGIMRYNWSNGIRPTREGGYHETLTLFWIHLVHRYLADVRLDTHLVALLNELIEMHDKHLPFAYYSHARLFSAAAKESWVEPDLRPLP